MISVFSVKHTPPSPGNTGISGNTGPRKVQHFKTDLSKERREKEECHSYVTQGDTALMPNVCIPLKRQHLDQPLIFFYCFSFPT